jgi:hypothetical protein
MECEFCGNIFKTKQSLHNHQNRARYCIKLQNREEDIKTHTCAWCNKSFILKASFEKHTTTCKYINHEDVLKLREEVERLREEIASQREEIASLNVFKKLYDKKDDITKTANTRNTIVFPGSLDLSQEHIKKLEGEIHCVRALNIILKDDVNEMKNRS